MSDFAFSHSVSPTTLVEKLLETKKKSPTLVRSTDYTFPAPSSSSSNANAVPSEEDVSTSTPRRQHVLTSWKMPEHLYRVLPSPLPTLARGLFTEQVSPAGGEGEGKETYRVVSRGYEKFFNVSEVAYTEWPSLERYTTGPYHLTLKSNGCLIMMSAIEPETVLVTSKHAMGEGVGGPDGETGVSHSQMGRIWMEKHLQAAGKTEKELAKALWDDNLTAVAELCDDSFEEHVLPYSRDLTGLHLHGLNKNVAPAFETLPPSAVASFAREFGFIETREVILGTMEEVRKFTDGVEERGEWEGQPVEGFVVRCTVKEEPAAAAVEELGEKVEAVEIGAKKGNAAKKGPTKKTITIAPPPYPAGTTFFFKVKFDHPYLLYRNFREITKLLLPLLDPLPPAPLVDVTADPRKPKPKAPERKPIKLPSSKLQEPESVLYERWCRISMETHPEWFEGIKRGKGIVAARERFLAWLGTEEGKQATMDEKERRRAAGGWKTETRGAKAERGKNGWGKTLIIPIAVPGCGKTAIGVALNKLFGFAHTQSDDITTKKTAAGFGKNVETLLKDKDVKVVYADRNNHMRQHRTQLSTIAVRSLPSASTLPTRIVALYFPIFGPSQPATLHELHRVVSSRVLARGDRHQSLRVAPEDLVRHEMVIWNFFNQHEALEDDDEADQPDEVIELGVQATLEESLMQVIDRLVPMLGLERPSEEKIAEALDMVKTYDPKVRKDIDGVKSAPPRYYALAPEIDLVKVAKQTIARATASSQSKWAVNPSIFLDKLIEDDRIVSKPHVTLVHEKEVEAELEAHTANGAAGSSLTTKPEDDPTSRRTAWETCIAIAAQGPRRLFGFKLGHLVWNDRVMAMTVEDIHPLALNDDEGAEAVEQLELPLADLEGMHVTVGTRDADVAPFESRPLVRAFRNGEAIEGASSIDVADVRGRGRVKGLS